MSNNQDNPTEITSQYEAKATEDLEKSVAEDLEVEDPVDAEAAIAAFESEGGLPNETDDEEEEDDAPSSPNYPEVPK